MTTLHLHFHFPPTGSDLLPSIQQLKELLTMNQAELKTALEGVAAQLTSVGDQLTAGEAQLQKATNEIIVAISNSGGTTAEVDAAVLALQNAGNALAGKGAAIGTAAQALDDLNADTPPN